MRALYAGIFFSLLGGVALAQTTPDPTAPGAAASPPAPNHRPDQPAATLPRPLGPKGGPVPAQGQADPSDSTGGDQDQYEGQIIQTPNGTFMVTEPPGAQGNGQPDDGAGMQAETSGPAAHPMPRPHPMMRSKAAFFRFRGPDREVDIKCPGDEPVKACADAAAQLIDKMGSLVQH